MSEGGNHSAEPQGDHRYHEQLFSDVTTILGLTTSPMCLKCEYRYKL